MKTSSKQAYGIGAVARQTGIPAPNIRMWEKRYGAVAPDRTESNRRLYSSEDLERLMMMKTLTEGGHAISHIADLSKSQLHELLESHSSAEEVSTLEASSPRVVAIGLRPSFFDVMGETLNLKIGVSYESIEAAAGSQELTEVDLLLIETESLFPETVAVLRELVSRAGSPPGILVYRFAATKTAAALARSIEGMTVLKAPVADRQLRRECLIKLSKGDPAIQILHDNEPSQIPEHLYTTKELSYLAGISSTVLVDLLARVRPPVPVGGDGPAERDDDVLAAALDVGPVPVRDRVVEHRRREDP
ncbi:MAG: MerR family transcriptional regulator, partial [Verrucomicrobiota bacterium]